MAIQGRSIDDCIKTKETFIDNLVHSENYLCANYMENTSISEGHNGGGLVFKRSDSWFVRGIVSSESNVNGTNYVIFKDVRSHFKWIYDNTMKHQLTKRFKRQPIMGDIQVISKQLREERGNQRIDPNDLAKGACGIGAGVVVPVAGCSLGGIFGPGGAFIGCVIGGVLGYQISPLCPK